MEKNNDQFCQPLERSVILGFRREVDEKRAFLSYYAANGPEQCSSLEQRATNCLAARLSSAQTYVHISRFNISTIH
jgi:hypothetical protein